MLAHDRFDDDTAPEPGPDVPSQAHSIGAGYLVLVARELTGLSQRRLAEYAQTTQPSLAKIESGQRIPTVRTLLRFANAAGFELVLGLREADADAPVPGEVDAFALVGILRANDDDDLLDFIVLREPSVFDGPGRRPVGGGRTET